MKKRKDGRYYTKAIIKFPNGESKVKDFYGKTQKEVRNNISLARAEAAKGSTKSNFGVLAEEWKTEKEKLVGHQTMHSYIGSLRRLEPLYGKDIEDIVPHDIQKIINNLYAERFSKSIMLRLRLVYSMIVDYAIKKGIVVANYAKQISIPKNAIRNERKGLTQEEIEIINNNINVPFGFYAFLMLYTGLRRGEICALRWRDIDLDNKTINITSAVEYIANQAHLKEPKTKAGERSVPILDNVLPYLTERKASDELFIFGDDKPLSETMVKKRWLKYINEVGLQSITQHQLRHTFATLLYKAGVDVKTAQTLLGHSESNTTLDVYTHIDQQIKTLSADKINEYIASN